VDDDRSIDDICLHTHSSEFFVSQVLYQGVQEGRLKIVRPRVAVAEPELETKAEDKNGAPLTNAEAMVAEALAHIRAGVYEPATRYLRAAASLEPNNREISMVVRELEGENASRCSRPRSRTCEQ
jgi:hypothetical protein